MPGLTSTIVTLGKIIMFIYFWQKILLKNLQDYNENIVRKAFNLPEMFT